MPSRFCETSAPQLAIEYGLIVTGIAIGTLAVLSGIGDRLNAAFLVLTDAV